MQPRPVTPDPYDDPVPAFADIERVRAERRIPKAALCKRAGVAPSTYWFIQQGKVEPRARTLRALADALNEPGYSRLNAGGAGRPAWGCE